MYSFELVCRLQVNCTFSVEQCSALDDLLGNLDAVLWVDAQLRSETEHQDSHECVFQHRHFARKPQQQSEIDRFV